MSKPAVPLPIRRRPVRIGLIGCGMVAKVGHAPALKADPRALIAACADPDDRNRERFEKKFGVKESFRDHREMLERADLDAVVIATPPWLHAEQVEDAAQKGRAILCEKPLAGTIEDCDRILASSGSRPFQRGKAGRWRNGDTSLSWGIDILRKATTITVMEAS